MLAVQSSMFIMSMMLPLINSTFIASLMLGVQNSMCTLPLMLAVQDPYVIGIRNFDCLCLSEHLTQQDTISTHAHAHTVGSDYSGSACSRPPLQSL